MWAQRISPTSSGLSSCQRRLRRQAQHVPFEAAVRLVADALFHFTHRETQAKALWSDSICAWLGSVTFVHWALGQADMDIPRIVAGADGAPDTVEALHEEVRLELLAYWADRLASLPPKSTPHWLPLP